MTVMQVSHNKQCPYSVLIVSLFSEIKGKMTSLTVHSDI